MTYQSSSDAELHAQLEAILTNAVDAIITIDERGIVQSVNPATEKLFGYPENQVVGQNVCLLMPSPYREEHNDYISNYVRTGNQKIIGIGREVIGRRKDGSTFPMHLAVSEIKIANRKLFTGMVRDLTDLKRAEAEQASFGRIFEESLNELFFFDGESLKFIQVNRGARENLGYTMEELAQMTPLDLKPQFSASQFSDLISPLKSGEKEKIVFETIHRRRNGSNYDVEVHLQMGWMHDRRVFVAIILDTTVRKQAERQLSRMNEELEKRVNQQTAELKAAQAELVRKERLAMLGQVSGGIAHEIRNPLNVVKTSAYYLLNVKSPSNDKTKEHLNRIDRQVTMIDNVVTALSDVARLPDPNLTPVDVTEVLHPVIQTTNMPSEIKVQIIIDDDLPYVLADEYQIPIVFRNLIRNARDAMSQGGTMTVTVQRENEMVCISVKDEGIGIPQEDMDRILEPLYSTKARGMGLGLAISRSILEKNRGHLSITSEPGVGSTFKVCLEAVKDQA